MLRLHDPRSGQVEPLPPGLLRTTVHGVDLRVHVTADLLRRVAERHDRKMWITRQAAELPFRPEAFNIRPAEAGPGSLPGGDSDLHVSEISVPGRRVAVGPTDPAAPGAGAEPGTQLDPLAARLAMLRAHYRERLALSRVVLSAADADLRYLRRLVAGWSESPGRPMSAEYLTAAETALADDLDTPAALRVLTRMATDRTVPAGTKFETFVHFDMVLALDLVAEVAP